MDFMCTFGSGLSLTGRLMNFSTAGANIMRAWASLLLLCITCASLIMLYMRGSLHLDKIRYALLCRGSIQRVHIIKRGAKPGRCQGVNKSLRESQHLRQRLTRSTFHRVLASPIGCHCELAALMQKRLHLVYDCMHDWYYWMIACAAAKGWGLGLTT